MQALNALFDQFLKERIYLRNITPHIGSHRLTIPRVRKCLSLSGQLTAIVRRW